MDDLFNKIITDELNKFSLKEKMTGFLVNKKKRGTYQAFVECSGLEKKLVEDVRTYIKEWFTNELLKGEIGKKLVKEIQNQTNLEIYRLGFTEIPKL